MSTICTQCQSLNPPSAKFCPGCGNCLVASSSQTQMLANSADAAVRMGLTSKTLVRPAPTSTMVRGNLIPPTRTGRVRRERVVFVVDVSGSMGERYNSTYIKIQSAIRACMSMVIEKKRIDPLDEIAIVVFNDKAIVLIALVPVGAHRAEIFHALQSLQADGGTDINEGLKAAEKLFDWGQTDVTNKIILLTDGHGGHPLGTAADLKSRGVIIHVIGVGDSPENVDERLLKQVASTVNNELQYWFIKDHHALVTEVTGLANKTVVAA